jgi:hypothetical protein
MRGAADSHTIFKRRKAVIMFSRIRRHVNATTVLAIVALVFAMTGGALAVGGHGGASPAGAGASAALSSKAAAAVALVAKATPAASAAKAKARGKTGPRGPAGKEGKPGKEGPAGKEGAAGKEGPAGKEGKEGQEGKEGKEGKEGEKGKAGKPGAPGQTGFTETLPAEKTETGSWSYSGLKETLFLVPISFAIPLPAPLEEKDVHWVAAGGASTAECPGSAEKPAAKPGNLCVYASFLNGTTSNATPGFIDSSSAIFAGGAGTAGAVLSFGTAEGASVAGYGTWAVTAPEEG